MSNKLRPTDGPGANGLRGGRNVYPSGKTAIGVWLDSKGGPSGYKRGFHTTDYQTEGQHAQEGAQFYDAPAFGAELPNPEHIHRKPPETGDLFNPLYSGTPKNDYETNTSLGYKSGLLKVTETHLPKSNMSRTELENYQKTWSSDTPASRAMRFQTENRRAGNAANKNFQTPTLRLFPGTPIIIDQFRTKLLEKYGILALSVLRHCIGTGVISCDEWRTRLAATDIKLYPHEINQILAYFTPTLEINVDKFLRLVVGRNEGFNAKDIKGIFTALWGARVGLDDILVRMNETDYPELVDGFKEFVGAYADNDDSFGADEFVLMHQDLYACGNERDYPDLIQGLWGKIGDD